MFGLTDPVLSALISAGLGFSGAIIAILLNRGKSKAEIANLTAQNAHLMALANKLEAETNILRKDTNSLTKTVKSVSERVSAGDSIIYDSSAGLSGFDFQGRGEHAFGGDTKNPKGEGTFKVEKDTIKIRRTNVDGSYRLLLTKYMFRDKEYDFLPKNNSVTGKRRLLVRCDAHSSSGTSRLLTFCLRTKDMRFVTRSDPAMIHEYWDSVERYFRVDPLDDLTLWIEDSGPSREDSSLYVENILLLEVT